MRTPGLIVFILAGILMNEKGRAAEANHSENAPTPAVKYKGAKDLNFEELLIEGAVKRPELSVVTGDNDQDNNGLLRLRENFLDRMTVDASEEIP